MESLTNMKLRTYEFFRFPKIFGIDERYRESEGRIQAILFPIRPPIQCVNITIDGQSFQMFAQLAITVCDVYSYAVAH